MSVGRLAARIPRQSSSINQTWKRFSNAWSGVTKALAWMMALKIPATQAKIPKERTKISDALVILLTCNPRTIGTGMTAKMTSVTMLTIELKRPMLPKVLFGKHRVFESRRTL